MQSQPRGLRHSTWAVAGVPGRFFQGYVEEIMGNLDQGGCSTLGEEREEENGLVGTLCSQLPGSLALAERDCQSGKDQPSGGVTGRLPAASCDWCDYAQTVPSPTSC